MPRSRWAFSTAIHSCRSSTILCSGDQIAARSAPAYRVARTLGTVTSGAVMMGQFSHASTAPPLSAPCARFSTVAERPEVPVKWVRRLRGLLAFPECVEEQAWTGVRWRVGSATVAHVFGGEDQLFRITFRAEPDEGMAVEHLRDPYLRTSWGRNVVGGLLGDENDRPEVGGPLPHSHL